MHRWTKMHMTRLILCYSLYCVWNQICSVFKVCLHPEYVSHIYTHGTCLCTESGPSVLHKLEFNLTYKVAIKIIKLARPTFPTFNLYNDKFFNFFGNAMIGFIDWDFIDWITSQLFKRDNMKNSHLEFPDGLA